MSFFLLKMNVEQVIKMKKVFPFGKDFLAVGVGVEPTRGSWL